MCMLALDHHITWLSHDWPPGDHVITHDPAQNTVWVLQVQWVSASCPKPLAKRIRKSTQVCKDNLRMDLTCDGWPNGFASRKKSKISCAELLWLWSRKSTQVFDLRSNCVSFGHPLALICVDLRWLALTYDDLRWLTMTCVDLRWLKMTCVDLRWPAMTYDDLRWLTMT